MKGEHDGIVAERIFYPESSLFSGVFVCWLMLEGTLGTLVPKFRVLEEGEKLNLATKNLVSIVRWNK